ncbi:MAG: RluA family pseudouridine synthase [bacterium]|nr:RluA family pseudouridine synthase [bacterium]
MNIPIIYEDEDLLIADKPAGIDVIDLGKMLSEKYSELKGIERNGIIHRLDKNTSGLILIAKNEGALIFFQKQFINRNIEKRYSALVVGRVEGDRGVIEALIGRSPKDRTRQKVYLPFEPKAQDQRDALTEYKVLKRLKSEKEEDYTLIEAFPKTGRKHQIRVHLAYIHHPIAKDDVYGFKGQPCPDGLSRQFLHAGFIKVKMRNGEIKEFTSDLPEDLKIARSKLYEQDTGI